jgi:hypothetical protein
MSWAKELKEGLQLARVAGGNGPILDMIEDVLEVLATHGITGHADLLARLNRRERVTPFGRRKDDRS